MFSWRVFKELFGFSRYSLAFLLASLAVYFWAYFTAVSQLDNEQILFWIELIGSGMVIVTITGLASISLFHGAGYHGGWVAIHNDSTFRKMLVSITSIAIMFGYLYGIRYFVPHAFQLATIPVLAFILSFERARSINILTNTHYEQLVQ